MAGITATLVKTVDLAQHAQMHFYRLAIFNITGLSTGANTITYKSLFPSVNTSWSQTTGGQVPESEGPKDVGVNSLSPDGSASPAAPALDSTNGGTVSAGAGLGWDFFTGGHSSGGVYYGNVYVICPSGTTSCQLILEY